MKAKKVLLYIFSLFLGVVLLWSILFFTGCEDSGSTGGGGDGTGTTGDSGGTMTGSGGTVTPSEHDYEIKFTYSHTDLTLYVSYVCRDCGNVYTDDWTTFDIYLWGGSTIIQYVDSYLSGKVPIDFSVFDTSKSYEVRVGHKDHSGIIATLEITYNNLYWDVLGVNGVEVEDVDVVTL